MPHFASTSERPFTLAVLGGGRQGLRLYDAASRLSGATVVAIGSEYRRTSGAPGETLRLPAAATVESYESLMSRNELDGVMVALPNSLHERWCRRALERQLHVLGEKPLCLTSGEATGLAALASRSGTVIAEAFSYPFHPQHDFIRTTLEAESIGPIELLEAHFQYSLDDTNDIRFRAELGGGALNDVGCYLLDWTRRIANSELQHCQGLMRGGAKGVDTVTHLQLGFANGIAAHLTCGSTLPRENWCKITGRNGTITAHRAFLAPPGAKCAVEVRTAKGTRTETFSGADQTTAMLEAFVTACRGGPLDPRFSDWQTNAARLEAACAACAASRNRC